MARMDLRLELEFVKIQPRPTRAHEWTVIDEFLDVIRK